MNYPQGPGPYPPPQRPPYPPQHGQPQHGQPPGPYQPYPQAPVPGPYQGRSAYPPPQPGPHGYGQPAEGIAVNTQYFPLGFTMALFKPKIVIDGYEAPAAGWGRTVVAARPGPHHVHVHVPYWLPSQIGPADTSVEVQPGRLVELEYKAPVWGFSRGSLGAPPQSYNGVGITIGVIAVSLFFAVMLPLLMILARM
jgi:hypothetical protein